MGTWNHRIVDLSTKHEPCLALREVYYDEKGEPAMHGEPFLCGDHVEELKGLLDKMQGAINAPVLSLDDFTGDLGDS
jgi:hypothetical protein